MNAELEKRTKATIEMTKMLHEATGDIKFKASYTLQELEQLLGHMLMDNLNKDDKYYEIITNFFEQLKELAEDFIKDNK